MPSIHVLIDQTKMIQITTLDLNRVLHAVVDLEDIDKDRAVKSGLRAGGNVFLRAGRRNLIKRLNNDNRKKRRLPGNLLSSMTVRVKSSKPGVLAGFNGFGPHAHLVDLGTRNRTPFRKKRKAIKEPPKPNIMKGNKFWSDAKQANEEKALRKVFEGIERAVIRIQNRQQK